MGYKCVLQFQHAKIFVLDKWIDIPVSIDIIACKQISAVPLHMAKFNTLRLVVSAFHVLMA